MTFFVDHAADGQLNKWRLYFIDFPVLGSPVTGPVRWTDCDIDIEWSGYTWASKSIIPGAISTQPDGQASTSFSVADGDGTLFPWLSALSGGELSLATIYEAGFALTNKSAVPDDVLQIFSGRVERATAHTENGDSIEIVLMPPAEVNSAKVPFRLLSTLVK